MDKVTIITGVAVPLMKSNIDTDTIIRIDRLTQQTRSELGRFALEALRYRQDGSEDSSCVLNRPAFRNAPILLAGENFGCGSSREGAVWALLASGLRCVIAESFGDIFYNNCFQNGLLPIRLAESHIRLLAGQSESGHVVTVDLTMQTVRSGTVERVFEIEPNRREAMLEGLDEISQTLKQAEEIAQWQARDRRNRPWIWGE
jgi:3-isopropylmalate/(R)-2-methylmalate dehydratase small subunit